MILCHYWCLSESSFSLLLWVCGYAVKSLWGWEMQDASKTIKKYVVRSLDPMTRVGPCHYCHIMISKYITLSGKRGWFSKRGHWLLFPIAEAFCIDNGEREMLVMSPTPYPLTRNIRIPYVCMSKVPLVSSAQTWKISPNPGIKLRL